MEEIYRVYISVNADLTAGEADDILKKIYNFTGTRAGVSVSFSRVKDGEPVPEGF